MLQLLFRVFRLLLDTLDLILEVLVLDVIDQFLAFKDSTIILLRFKELLHILFILLRLVIRARRLQLLSHFISE